MLDGDPSLVLSLYARLPMDSMTRSIERGGEEGRWFLMDTGPYQHVLAGIYDAVNLNTTATGWYAKGKAPKFDPWILPERQVEQAKKQAERKTVAGIFKAMGGVMPEGNTPKRGAKASFVPVK